MAEFVDELPSTGRGRAFDKEIAIFADELRDNPGKWAKWPKEAKYSVSVIGTNIRKGRYVSLAEGFEAAVRQGVLYVRYVGEAA